MSIPNWAGSMISNYRTMYLNRYGRETTCTDEQIYVITREVFDDGSSAAQDAARVEAMHEQELL